MSRVFSLCFIIVFLPVSVFGVELSEYLLNQKAKKAYEAADDEKLYELTQELFQQAPDNGKYLYNLGESSLKLNKIDDAINYFSRAEQLLDNDEKVSAMLALGAAHLLANNLDESLEINKKALKLDPGNRMAKHNLELALMAKAREQQESQSMQNQDDQNSDNDQDSDKQKDPGNFDQNQNDYDQDDPPENDEDNPDDSSDDDSLQQKQEESETSKDDAKAVLNRLLQEEEESRRKHMKRPFKELGVEHDW